MKPQLIFNNLCCASVLGVLASSGQAAEDSANRFGLSYRAGFSIKADFKNLGAPAAPGGPSTTGLSYEDGFVRPNSEPNDVGLSWNWGYQNGSQVVGDNAVLTSSQVGKLGTGDADAPANGVELTYNRRLGHWGKSSWGLEGALNYTDVNINDNSAPAAGVLTAHAFNLGGQTPPLSPYAGTPEGPGILISDTPTTAALNVNSKVSTSLFGLRLGPYWELPLGERFAISLSGGFALAWADSDFSYREQVSVGGVSGVTHAGTDSQDDWLPGWYVGGSASLRLCRGANLFVGVQFQDVGEQVLRAGDKQSTLDLGQSVFLTLGVSYSF